MSRTADGVHDDIKGLVLVLGAEVLLPVVHRLICAQLLRSAVQL